MGKAVESLCPCAEFLNRLGLLGAGRVQEHPPKKEQQKSIRQDTFLERETGIEPATPSLARRCSTAEPLAHIYLF